MEEASVPRRKFPRYSRSVKLPLVECHDNCAMASLEEIPYCRKSKRLWHGLLDGYSLPGMSPQACASNVDVACAANMNRVAISLCALKQTICMEHGGHEHAYGP